MKRFALSLAALVLALASMAQTHRMLVGTYTEGTSAEGVYLFSFDESTAAATLLGVAPSGNPSFVVTSPDGTHAYAVNEYNDGRQGVSAFSLEGSSIRALGSRPIPREQVSGEDPCNLLYLGDALLSANYTGGSVTAFPLDKAGRIGPMSQFSAPSIVDENAHPLSHMHCATLSPDGQYIFVTDLGLDLIHRFRRGQGGAPLGIGTVAWKNADNFPYGPRHFIFSADGRFAYLLCELGDQLVVFSYADGELTPIQTLTAYDGGGKGSADLHLSPDGRFLYTSHRLQEDGIAIFAVDPLTGLVEKAGYQPTGKHPRNFAISPEGRFLLCACRDSNCIEVYRINPETGALSRTDQTIQLGAPVCITFVPDNN